MNTSTVGWIKEGQNGYIGRERERERERERVRECACVRYRWIILTLCQKLQNST